ncbi:MAG: hybrid sensor histidine kinase/response regulator [Deltaproteobacteria bacterium]|nr:hybrid sensor histidine kinase/response regulator [Deltaproteobacteria bacterium]
MIIQTLTFLKRLIRKATGSFTAKIFIVQAVSVVIISLIFTGYFILRERRAMTELLLNKGEILAQQLADACRIGVFAENADLVEAPLANVLKQKEVLGVRVFTLQGKLLRERRSQDADRSCREAAPGLGANRDVFRTLRETEKPVTLQKSTCIEIWTPILTADLYSPDDTLLFTDNPAPMGERIIGFAELTLDTSQVNTTYRNLLAKSILICAAFLALALGIAFFVARGITRPLILLRNQVKALGAGIEVATVPVETGDELGKLSGAFNSMAESLRMRQAEKEQLESQLRHAQKMEAIGQLAGGVAHDFNNILCAIIGFGTLLEMGMGKDDPARDHLKQILSAADRATNLTQSLLAFSRKQIINPRHANLNEIVGDIEKMLNRLITEDIELRIVLTERALGVLVDQGQIDQVLVNLVTNARDAMPQGGVLTIETAEAEPPDELLIAPNYPYLGKCALLTVSDTGSGIDSVAKDRIFEPFFTTKEVGKGTGLGLSMVYGIVKQHDGHITAHSEPGIGTSFRIYLPMVDNVPTQPERADEPATSAAGSETVLVVEDNPEVRVLNRAVLETFGYRVLEAMDGEEAVAQFFRHRDEIDLVVMDVVMPRKNGREAYGEIIKVRPDVRVLFMSGYTSDIVEEKGIIAEGVNFISKPVNPLDMLKKIRELLDA